jgi:hypothetical protein
MRYILTKTLMLDVLYHGWFKVPPPFATKT